MYVKIKKLEEAGLSKPEIAKKIKTNENMIYRVLGGSTETYRGYAERYNNEK